MKVRSSHLPARKPRNTVIANPQPVHRLPLAQLHDRVREAIDRGDVPPGLLQLKLSALPDQMESGGRPSIPTVDEMAGWLLDLPIPGSKLEAGERAVFRAALKRSQGNKSGAARLLGVDRKVVERAARASHR